VRGSQDVSGLGSDPAEAELELVDEAHLHVEDASCPFQTEGAGDAGPLRPS
jgi:hypothetical protein